MRRRIPRWTMVAAVLAATTLASGEAGAAGAAERQVPVPAGVGRLDLRAGDIADAVDVEVIAFLDDAVRFLDRRRMAAGDRATVDVPLRGRSGVSVQVRGQRAGAPDALPEVFSESVPVESGRVRPVTVAPNPHRPLAGAACGSQESFPFQTGDLASTAPVDIDGDGDRETARVWSYVEGGVRRWRLGVQGPEPPGRQMVSVALPAPTGFDAARPETAAAVTGAADVDADGTDEVVVTTGVGGHTRTIQLYGLQDCALVPVTIEGRPGPASFAVGASATDKSGLSCFYFDGPRLTSWRATSDDRSTYTVTITEHRWRAPHVLDAGVTWSWTVPATDEWTLLESGGLRCGRPTHTLTG